MFLKVGPQRAPYCWLTSNVNILKAASTQLPQADRLVFPKALQNRIDILQAVDDIPFRFGSGEDDLSVDEDEQHNPWLHHPVDQPWEQFRFVRAELAVHLVQVLQPNGKPQIYGGDQILYLKLQEPYVVAQLLDDSCKFPRRQVGIGFVAGPGADDFPRSEDQRRTAGLAYPHHDTVKPGWIVFGVSQAEVDGLEVQFAA